MAPMYLKIFDPRAVRAAGSGLNAQAEAVTGTHLYAYLQDQELPPELVKWKESSRRGSSSSSGSSKSITLDTASLISSDRAHHIQEIFQTAESFARYNEEPVDLKASAEQHEAFSKRSLLQELKATKETFMMAFFLIHETVCAEISMPRISASAPSILSVQRDCATIEATLTPGDGRISRMTAVQGTARSEVTCADDALVSDFSLSARQSIDCLEGHNRKTNKVEEHSTICLESAALTAAIITTPATDVNGEVMVLTDLVVLCRSLSCETSEEKLVYVARVSLTQKEPSSTSAGSQIKCVQKVALYIAPSPVVCQAAVSRIIPKEREEEEEQTDSHDGMRDNDNAGWTSLEDDDNSEDQEKEKPAGIVCVGPAIEQGEDGNGLSACLMLISLKDLHFNALLALDIPSNTDPLSTNFWNADTLTVDVILGLDAQTLGTSEGEVSFRERLLSIDIPEEKGRMILESRASRGVVLVGVATGIGGAGSGGKVIVVDMELDEDDEAEEEEEESEDEEEEEDDDAGVTGNDHNYGPESQRGYDINAMVTR